MEGDFVDAGPRVRETHMDMDVVGLHVDRQTAAFRHGLDGVLDQIVGGLSQLACVAQKHGNADGDPRLDGDLLVFDLRPHEFQRVFQKFFQIKRLHLRRLRADGLQEVLDDAIQPSDLLHGHVDMLQRILLQLAVGKFPQGAFQQLQMDA